MQRSIKPNVFSRGSRSIFLDRDRLVEALRQLCQRACQRCPDIERVLLFGSVARGEAGPKSDADLFVILKSSAHPRAMDRIPGLLDAMRPLPVAIDVVPWTRAEYEAAKSRGDPWLSRIEDEGLVLL